MHTCQIKKSCINGQTCQEMLPVCYFLEKEAMGLKANSIEIHINIPKQSKALIRT